MTLPGRLAPPRPAWRGAATALAAGWRALAAGWAALSRLLIPARVILRPSLRRRTAAGAVVLSVAGIVLADLAYTAITDDWSWFTNSGGCHVSHFMPTSGGACYPNNGLESFLQTGLLLAALSGFAWLAWVTAGRVLRPLAVTTVTVRQLGPQNLGQRIHLGGHGDEFRDLADAIDETLDRMAAGYEAQRRFAANASHELRTPLAVQRLLTEVALDDPQAGGEIRRLGAQLLRANERNVALIEGLLVLAESDRGLPGKVPVRLDELATAALDAHADLAASGEVGLRRSLGPRLVPGDPLLLEQLITNLIANAVKYNEPGGWVEVTVGTEPALTVRNTGPDVPAEAVSSLFEPFKRLAADRTGHGGEPGLGLSIVRSVTAAHAGTVRARPRDGGGLIVEIDLPEAAAPRP